jgi:hypothetical protein
LPFVETPPLLAEAPERAVATELVFPRCAVGEAVAWVGRELYVDNDEIALMKNLSFFCENVQRRQFPLVDDNMESKTVEVNKK